MKETAERRRIHARKAQAHWAIAIRARNRRALLTAIREHGPLDTYELADLLGVTPRTILRIAPPVLKRTKRVKWKTGRPYIMRRNGQVIRMPGRAVPALMTVWYLDRPPVETSEDENWGAFHEQVALAAQKIELRHRGSVIPSHVRLSMIGSANVGAPARLRR